MAPLGHGRRPGGESLNVYVLEWAFIAAGVLFVIGVWRDAQAFKGHRAGAAFSDAPNRSANRMSAHRRP